jgi:hypothetical protein
MPPPPITESEYVVLLNLLSTEIENAFIIFHTYEGLNHLAHNDSSVLTVLNADALFWNTYRNTLVSSIFMTASRIFDDATDAITMRTLLGITLGNLHLFSKNALRARKIGTGPEPEWLDGFMAQTWEPTEPSQLRHLQKALKPHAARFKDVYVPVRNAVYAHRLMSDDQADDQLYPKTNREELAKMLLALQDLIDTLRDLYDNGAEPVLGQRNYTENEKRARSGVETILRKLVAEKAAATA